MNDLRHYIDLLESIQLNEKKLDAKELPAGKLSGALNPKTQKPFTRHDLFLHKIANNSSFTLVKGGEVIIDPRELKRAKAWLATGPVVPEKFNTINGGTVKNTELQKTVEFGSSEKETIELKGSDIFSPGSTDVAVNDMGNKIQDILKAGGFPASEMYEQIVNSPKIAELGKVGEAIRDMASHIAMLTPPTVPPGLPKPAVKAIEVYASEYLGVLGLLTGTTTFKQGNRQQFDEFIGTSLSEMIMYFPKDTANPLADSFSVVNDSTGHAIKISSKAAGHGAAPSMGSLKVPDDVRKKYPEFYEFYTVANDESYTMFEQPFIIMNWLLENHPSTIPAAYKNMMPFDAATINACQTSFKTKKPMAKGLFNLFAKRLGDQVKKNTATDGGKAWYAVCSDMVKIVNDGRTIKNLRAGIIESLGHNFIQLYSNIKGDVLVTEAFWPAKIHGDARVKSKGYAGNPNYGRLSFELDPNKTADDMGQEPVSSNAPALDAKAKEIGTAHSIGGLRPNGAKSKPGERKSPDDQRGYRN